MLDYIELYKKIKIREQRKEMLSYSENAFINTFQQINKANPHVDNCIALNRLCEQLAKNLN